MYETLDSAESAHRTTGKILENSSYLFMGPRRRISCDIPTDWNSYLDLDQYCWNIQCSVNYANIFPIDQRMYSKDQFITIQSFYILVIDGCSVKGQVLHFDMASLEVEQQVICRHAATLFCSYKKKKLKCYLHGKRVTSLEKASINLWPIKYGILNWNTNQLS